jgi:predicted metal-dependent hydrolase
LTEASQVRYGGTSIEFQIVRTTRRKKTVSLSIDGESGLLVAAPLGLSVSEIQAIVRRRAPWIVRRARPQTLELHPRQFVSGESVLYLGRRVRMALTRADVPEVAIKFKHWSFEVIVPDKLEGGARTRAVRQAFVSWYKLHASARLTMRARHWQSILGMDPVDLRIRDQRQRWASCSADGVLRFNWRVVMAEPSLLDYVIVHELAHLVVKNHSAEFWRLVAAAMPDYSVRRRHLREIGPYLSL